MATRRHEGSKRPYRVHKIRRTVRSLVGMKKVNSTLERGRDGAYAGHVWLDKQLHEAVAFLASANGCSMKQLTHTALRVGLSRLLTDAILDARRRAESQLEEGSSAKPTRFVSELKRLAKDKGIDLGDVL
jgi:hypothetical protein